MNDELNQKKKPFNWNSSYATGIVLLVIAVISLFIGLSFGVIFYFPFFVGIAGAVILIHAYVTKPKPSHTDKSDIIDDLNEI